MQLAPDVKRALDGLNARRPYYQYAQGWYDGEYNLSRILEKLPIRNVALKEALSDLNENLCPLVVDTLSERLQLDGMETAQYADAAAKILKRWRIEAFQGEVHRRTATQGDGYLLVWAYPDKPAQAWFHDAYEMAVERNQEDPSVLNLAIKNWTDDQGRERLTVYRPQIIERYYKQGNKSNVEVGRTFGQAVWGLLGFTNTTITAGNGDWLPFEEGGPSVQNNPLGLVPVAVFNNARYRNDGTSELHNVIGPQRFLNKSLVDIALATEGGSINNRYILGLDFDIDPETGKARADFDAKEPVWAFAGGPDKVQVGQFAPVDFRNMAEGSTETYRKSMARVSRTPLHYLGYDSGGWPSGEALKTAEAPFTAKVDRRKAEYGEPWEDAVRFALMFEANASPDTDIEAKWKDTRPRAEYEYWQGQQIQSALGKSQDQIWTEEGYSASEIARMKEQKKAENQATVDAMARSFASGGQTLE